MSRIRTVRQYSANVPPDRHYFYYVSNRGRLYNITETTVKMPYHPAYFKADKFLNFFFRNIKRNDTGKYPDFPYLSMCGREFNFVKVEDTPIVFLGFDPLKENLIYAGLIR